MLYATRRTDGRRRAVVNSGEFSVRYTLFPALRRTNYYHIVVLDGRLARPA